MFIQQLHDFDVGVGRNARLARLNVELEQSAHRIDSWTTDGQVQRSLAIVVDRVVIDAIQGTQQLARAHVAVHTCEMQWRPTFFVKKQI